MRASREFGAPDCLNLSFVQDCLHTHFYEDEPAATQPWHRGQRLPEQLHGDSPSLPLPITGVTGICAAWSPFYKAAPLGRVVALPWSPQGGKHKNAEFSLGLSSNEQLTENRALTRQTKLLFILTLLLEVTHFFERKPQTSQIKMCSCVLISGTTKVFWLLRIKGRDLMFATAEESTSPWTSLPDQHSQAFGNNWAFRETASLTRENSSFSLLHKRNSSWCWKKGVSR